MVYSYGGRVDNDSNAITKIDEENLTAETKGYINGEYVEFSGGESDFSTAEVTFINNTGDTVQMQMPFINGDYSSGGMFIVTGTSTKNIIIYKDGAEIHLYTKGISVLVSGGITFDGVDGIITSDCTMTFDVGEDG